MKTTSPAVRAFSMLALFGLALLAGGCRSSYSVDVRNLTPQPMYVQVVSRNDAGLLTLASRRLGPGDRGGLGPFTVPQSDIVSAVADTVPNPARAPELTLRPGLTVLEVTQEGDKTAGELRLREIGATSR